MSVNIAANPSALKDTLDVFSVDRIVHLPKVIAKAIADKVDDLNREFRTQLLRDSEWKELAGYSIVEVRDESVVVSVEHPRAVELEYGSSDTPMNSRIRIFQMYAVEEVAKAIDKATEVFK